MPTPPAPPPAVTRQRRWQLAQRAAGRCAHCGGEPVPGYVRCAAELERRKLRQRRAAERAKEER